MKKLLLPLVLLFAQFFLNGCSGPQEPVCATMYAVMGKPPEGGSGGGGGLYGGAGICSSSENTFAKAIPLECCYDTQQPDRITISFKVADMMAQDSDHYNLYFKKKQGYTFDADYILSNQNVLSQLGLTSSPRIPGNTPSLSLTNDGTTVTFVMPVVM